MSVLDSHIEAEISAFVLGSSSANATEAILLDHSDRWNELPNVVKIASRGCTLFDFLVEVRGNDRGTSVDFRGRCHGQGPRLMAL